MTPLRRRAHRARERTGVAPIPAVVAMGVVAALSAAACARTVPPRGGDVPETPVRVVETAPDTFAVVEPFDGPVRIEFDRRISERAAAGQLREAVVVSPRTGEVSVRHQRRGIEVEMAGGFRGRTVYRITVLPALQDLWGNSMGEPWDLFFSTGPEFEPNVLGGYVTDRLTGEDAAGVALEAISLGEGASAAAGHSTVTDSTGIFTFPYLPADRYLVRAWDDQNRNYEADFQEPQDSVEVTLQRGDTLIVTELRLLAPDTTAAVVTSAAALDSLTVEIAFDDHLDPDRPLDEVAALLERVEGGAAPGVAEILHRHEWEARVAALAAEEPAPAEPPDPDDPDTVPPPPPPPPDEVLPAGAQPGQTPPEEPLPHAGFVLVLDGPLEWEAAYRVVVEGVTNIQGVAGGGGEAGFQAPPEPEDPPDPPPTPPPPDSVQRPHAGP